MHPAVLCLHWLDFWLSGFLGVARALAPPPAAVAAPRPHWETLVDMGVSE